MKSPFYDLTSFLWPKNLPPDSTPQDSPKSSIYRTLEKSRCEIRICDLVPASNLSTPLRCTLRTVPIDEAGSFVAMSYVWGEAASTESILVDGVKHPIRPNLATGLRRLRERSRWSGQLKPISVWADAICINQSSIEERNHQVPLMRSIFSGCESAFAWLGESDQTSDLAMDSIAKMCTFLQKGMIGDATFLFMLVQEEFFWDSEPWVALSRLLQREFWYRVWIYQEVVLPKKLLVACGSKALPWENFQIVNGMRIFRGGSDKTSKLIRRHFAHLEASVRNEITAFCNTLHPIFTHKINYDNGKRLTLFELLAETIHLRSTDPRDKIYGLLALDNISTITPDYSMTVEEVYTEFAKTMLQVNLAYLRFGGWCTRESPKAMTSFPSWVPHWESMSRTMTANALQESKCFEFPRSNLTEMEFHHIGYTTVLHIRGEISSQIKCVKQYSDILDVENFRSMISSVKNTEYETTIEYPKTPTQRLLALCCTLVQALLRKDEIDDMALAAGFVHTVLERLESDQDWTINLLRSELQGPFGEYFEWIPWNRVFGLAHRYQDDYLQREREALEGRVLFETDNGYFGLGPVGAEAGDFLGLIYGYNDPVVLRRVGEHYVLVGTCWSLDYTDHYGERWPKSVMLEIW